MEAYKHQLNSARCRYCKSVFQVFCNPVPISKPTLGLEDSSCLSLHFWGEWELEKEMYFFQNQNRFPENLKQSKVAGGAFTFPLETSIIQKMKWKDFIEVSHPTTTIFLNFVFCFDSTKTKNTLLQTDMFRFTVSTPMATPILTIQTSAQMKWTNGNSKECSGKIKSHILDSEKSPWFAGSR